MRRARFYVDADLLALGKALVSARYDVTYPGNPGDPRRDPTTWGELGVVVHQWRSIAGLHEQDGPLLTHATKTTFREIDPPNRRRKVPRGW